MPYSEAHQMAKGNLDSTKLKMKNCPGDLAFRSDQEFVELLWENGQIVMQGHSSRMRKSSSSPGLVQEKDGGNAVSPKTRRYGLMESDVNGISATGPSGRVGIAHDDDLFPWLNYPVDDALQNDYCLEFFTELSGPSLKLLSSQHPSVPDEKNGRSSQVVRDPIQAPAHGRVNLEQGNASKAVRIRNGPLFLQSQQCRTSDPNPMLGDSAFVPNNNNKTQQSHFMNLTRRPALAAGMPISKMLKKDPLPIRPSQPSNNIGLMNFSHFSRPAALVKANLQNIGSVAVGTSGTDKFRGSHKVFLTNSDSIEPSVVESTRGLQSTAKGQPVSVPAKVDLKPPSRTPQEMTSTEKSEAVCQEDVSRNNISLDHIHQSSSFAASVALGRPESQKALDPAVASSSACSGNSTGVLLNGTKHGLKRKGQEVEESWYQSEDAEDESIDVKKPNKCPKRSRAAEVHNLSERRRRDRINEKMRALQELIPNCNKVDKASMLDEAIEYLKTLQLQLQIMSMGTGFCMPPMMLPAGIQNVHTSPMLHFPPLGVGMRMGMGMGMGFGMGMPDIGCLSGYPSLPIAPMHGPQFSSVSASMSLHDLPGPNLQMFGIQGQGLPLSSPHAPFVPSSGFATKLPPVPDLSVAACPMPVPDSALPSSSKDQNQDVAQQTMHKTVADCPENQPSTQVTRERLEQSDLVQGKYEISHIGGNEAINTTSINGIASGGTTGFD